MNARFNRTVFKTAITFINVTQIWLKILQFNFNNSTLLSQNIVMLDPTASQPAVEPVYPEASNEQQK